MKACGFSMWQVKLIGRISIFAFLMIWGVMSVWAVRLPVRIYTTRDGLPQAQVSGIEQDALGYLWVSTRTGGIGCFDGQTWKVYDTSNGLISAGIEALDISPGGTLFLGTNAGAVRREGNAWIPLEMPAQAPIQPVTDLLALTDRQVWIGTAAGLWYWRGPGRTAELATAPNTPGDLMVACIAQGSGNSIWVGTASGLYLIDSHDPQRLRPVPGLPSGTVRAVLDFSGRELWAAVYGKGLFRGIPGKFSRLGNDTAPGRSLLTLFAENNNPETIWVGTANLGAFRYEGGSWARFGRSEGFPEQSINAIFQDRESVIWFGTSVGLVKRAPVAFASFSPDEGFPDNGRFYGMAESRKGDIWFSAYEEGLFCLRTDGTVKRYTSRDGLPSSPVDDVEADPHSGVWVATRGGLARIDGDRVRPVALPAKMPTDLRTILVTPQGTIYLGTYHDGLSVLQNGRLRTIGAPVGRTITSLWRGRDGTIWCGGIGWGVVALRPGGALEVLGKAQGLPSDQVNDVFEDSRGTLWVSTECGACRRGADGQSKIYDRAAGLPDSNVYWTREDAQGAMWFGTNHGAARLIRDGRWEIYTSRDGLADDECNEDGVLVDSRNRVFIGSKSVALFLGRPIHKIPPPILLEQVRVGDRLIDPERATLRAGQGPLVFKLAAPTFINEESTRIRYRLIGLANTWNVSEPRQMQIAFGGLGPGTYRFEALAVTGDGLESDKPVVVSLHVPSRWWQSLSFILSALACVAFIILGAVRVREQRLKQSQHLLEEKVNLRTEELRLANERLAELAIKDDLTDLPNRRAILMRLREAISWAGRYSRPLAIAMIDIDNFKEVNDTLGHELGDMVLHKIAAAMKLSQRQEDTLGRYGGDEFLAVMPGCDESGAGRVVERLKAAVASVKVEGTESVLGQREFSASAGIAIFDPATSDQLSLVRKADDALYKAKAAL